MAHVIMQAAGIIGGGASNRLPFIEDAEIVIESWKDACYAGTGQVLTDLSGNGNNFHLGATTGGASDDPVFVGSAGSSSRNTHFTSDGTQYFELDQAQSAFIETMHKSNAAYTIVLCWRPKTTLNTGYTDAGYLLGNTGGNGTGFHLRVDSTTRRNEYVFEIQNGGTPALSRPITNRPWGHVPEMMAISVDEAGGDVSFVYRNGRVLRGISGSPSDQTFDAAYSSPSAGSSADALAIFADGDSAGNKVGGNCEFYALAIYNRALSVSEVDVVWAYVLPKMNTISGKNMWRFFSPTNMGSSGWEPAEIEFRNAGVRQDVYPSLYSTYPWDWFYGVGNDKLANLFDGSTGTSSNFGQFIDCDYINPMAWFESAIIIDSLRIYQVADANKTANTCSIYSSSNLGQSWAFEFGGDLTDAGGVWDTVS